MVKTVKYKAIKSKRQKIPKDLLEVLCCPKDKGDLVYKVNQNVLSCKKCKHNYKVENGIPNFVD